MTMTVLQGTHIHVEWIVFEESLVFKRGGGRTRLRKYFMRNNHIWWIIRFSIGYRVLFQFSVHFYGIYLVKLSVSMCVYWLAIWLLIAFFSFLNEDTRGYLMFETLTHFYCFSSFSLSLSLSSRFCLMRFEY